MLLITALIILFLGFLLMIMVEVGRTMIVREQLQTAADSAALAAANSGVHRMVEIDVTNDLGTEQHCDDEGNCSCTSCGTMPLPGIIGSEKELLDEGEWQENCLEPCGCSTGDCWYEIKDRWVQYDMDGRSRSLEPEKIEALRNNLTNTVITALSWKGYPYQQQTKNTIQGLTLEQILEVISSESNWKERYFAQNGYNSDYCNAYYAHPGYSEGCSEHQAEANHTFEKVSERSQWVEGLLKSLTKISSPSQQMQVDMSADDAAQNFFEANLPKHAEESWINEIDVYNYTRRDSPYYPSIVVRATSKVKSLFPNLFKTEGYETGVCAQGSTYYKDPRDEGDRGRNENARWQEQPEDACWEEL